jgi:UDP-N-acetylmuramate dehydrogenase
MDRSHAMLSLQLPDLRGALLEHAPVGDLTTYRIGGTARFLFSPADVDDLRAFLSFALQAGLRTAVLGGGSNVLLPDGEADLALVHLVPGLRSLTFPSDDRVRAGAGAWNRDLVEALAARGFGGFEFLHDIPGTVGGAVVMNASNNHGETALHVDSVEFVEHAPGWPVRTLPREQLEFGYRASPFQAGSGRTITAVTFRLAERGEPYALRERLAVLRAERAGKFPCEYANCGSVFRRPPGDFAGRLIEAAGCKGLREGEAMVSPKHAGFIVNLGHATSADIKRLILKVQERVMATSGVRLERELIYLE